jgi:hypothetical protein
MKAIHTKKRGFLRSFCSVVSTVGLVSDVTQMSNNKRRGELKKKVAQLHPHPIQQYTCQSNLLTCNARCL